MPDALTTTAVGDVVAVVALAALLVVAFRHPSGLVEAGIAAAAAGACLLVGATDLGSAVDAVRRLLPVVVFLAAILVVAGACADLGLFRAIGDRIGRPGTRPNRFLALTFVAAVAVTAVLSLDATVVLLTLVVLAAAERTRITAWPGLSACVRLANSSSLLLPVSNLTTLLALHSLDLSFGRFALVMAPAWVLVIAVEYAGHRLFFRRELREEPGEVETDGALSPLPRFPLVVVLVMLTGFAVQPVLGLTSAWGVAWTAVVAAVVLAVSNVRTARGTWRGTLDSAHLGFAAFVLGLGVVVEALTAGGLGRQVARLLPDGDGLGALLLLALIATVLANVVNNLPATLLLVPLVGPLGTVPVLALLVGLNVGSSLTWTGSLANLLWRRTLLHAGVRPSTRDFHALAALTVPVGVVVGVVAVWAWAPLVI